MSNEELLLLQKGRVPAQPIIAILQSWLDREEPWHPAYLDESQWRAAQAVHLATIADKIGVAHHTPYSWFKQKSLAFDIADEILCAIGRYNAWYCELSEYYQAVNLSDYKSGARLSPEQRAQQRANKAAGLCANGHDRGHSVTRISNGKEKLVCLYCREEQVKRYKERHHGDDWKASARKRQKAYAARQREAALAT